MPIGEGALAVAYHNVEDGPVVLLHTEVPEKLSGLCTDRDRRIASSKRCDAIMAIAKCPSGRRGPFRVRQALDRWPQTDGLHPHSAFGNDAPRLSNACPNGISNFV